MKTTIFISIFLSLISKLSSQTITWSKVFSFSDYSETAHTIKQIHNDGYILIGSQKSPDYFGVQIIRLNDYGDTVWTSYFQDNFIYGFVNIINLDIEFCNDSEYIFCWSKQLQNPDSSPLLLIWINDYGDTTKTKMYSINSDYFNTNLLNYPYNIERTSDSCFIIVGNNLWGNMGNDRGFLLKLNDDGDSLWTSFSLAEEMYFPSCVEGKNKSFITAIDGAYFYYRTLEKFDSLGNYQFALCSLGTYLNDIEMLADSNFIFVSNYAGPYSMVKITEDLDTIWTRPGIGYNDVAPCIDGGFVVTGSYNNDLFLAKFNTDGDSLWAVTYGGGGLDSGKCLEQTSDGGFIICGSTTSYGTGSSDFYIIKTDSLGYALGVEEDHAFIVGNKDGIIVENLFSGSVKISFVADNRNDFSLNIYDVSGREIIIPYSIGSEEGRIEFFIRDLKSGSYFFRIETVKETFEGKFTVF